MSVAACGSEPEVELIPPPDVVVEASDAPAVAGRTTPPAGEDPNFHVMMDALLSPRCINCHPSDGNPKQTDRARPHLFGVERGPSNAGNDGLTCGGCHQEDNNQESGVPGAPEWSLAPTSMAWEGLTRYEIARVMLDRSKNGDRSLEQLRHHLTEHALVLWAWKPGVNADGVARTPPPVPLDEYKTAVNAWFAAGAQIPGDPPRPPEVEGAGAGEHGGAEAGGDAESAARAKEAKK